MGSQSIWFQSQVWTSVCVYKHYHTVRPMFSPIFHPILMMVKETIFPVGTIHTLRQHNLDFFWPTHYVSINTVLNVSKTGNFLDPPTESFADVIYGWSQGKVEMALVINYQAALLAWQNIDDDDPKYHVHHKNFDLIECNKFGCSLRLFFNKTKAQVCQFVHKLVSVTYDFPRFSWSGDFSFCIVCIMKIYFKLMKLHN